MSSRRRRPCSPSLASPLDDDDLLAEILLRLPPQPSSLPRASLVSKRWRLLVSDRRFLRRFRIHHRRNPPLLGFFVENFRTLSFEPTMEAFNRVPPGRLSLHLDHDLAGYYRSHGCRHGLALISDLKRRQFLVCDTVTGDQHQLAIPPGFEPDTTNINGAVHRAAGDIHFQVVFVATDNKDTQRALACVYSSETGVWGDLVSTSIPSEVPNVYSDILPTVPAVLVGDSLYWILARFLTNTVEPPMILEFDLKRQSLAVILVPVDTIFKFGADMYRVIRAEGGRLGFLYLSGFTAQLWKMKTDCDGLDSWVLGRTVELDKVLSLNKGDGRKLPFIRGFAENNNVVFMGTEIGLFMVHLESLKFKKLFKTSIIPYCHPFECVYTAGIEGGHDAADLLHNA